MTIYAAYDKIAELIARLDPEQVLSLKANSDMQERLNFLIDKSKNSNLSKNEQDELYHFITLERLMRLAKLNVKKSLYLS
jgi:hypothetical protein